MDNIKKLMGAAAKSKEGALLVTSETNRFYASGFDSTDGMLVVTPDKAWFMTDSRYTEAARNTIKSAEVFETSREKPYASIINDILASEGIKELGFEDESLTYADYLMLSEKLNAKLYPEEALISGIRASKSKEELDAMIAAQRLAEKCFNEVLPLISTRITERQLATELMCSFLRNGAEDKSFDPIIVSAEHSSMPHGVPDNTLIKEGFLTIDFGVKLNGWCSDTTRTLCVGKPTDEMRKIYDIVLEAQLAGIDAAKAGVTGAAIDNAARDVIKKAGYGEYFGHGFGHSLGLQIHEAPNANLSNNEPMPVGAVISAEPGIYIPGKFGVRIEDVLYLTEDGNINITNLPKELTII